MRRTAAALGVLILAVGGYATADVYDVVPGVLTLERPADPPESAEPASPSPTGVPRLAGEVPVLDALDPDALAPTADGLSTELSDQLAADALGPRVGAIVRDARTGEILYEQGSASGYHPASTLKILTAAAVSDHMDLSQTMTTAVVSGDSTDEIVLVAGGDTMLARGVGDPEEVEGRAGLADLADEVAAALRADGRTAVTLRLDATHAAGPRYPSGWSMADVDAGYTQGVSMIGLAGQRPIPGRASPRSPERATLTVLAARLEDAGIEVEVEDPGDSRTEPAPGGAEQLGSVESAPIGEVLALALADSDNALTENLARQGADADGAGTSEEEVTAWILDTLQEAGVDTAGTTLRDASGLSRGQQVPPRVISEAMQLGVADTGSPPDSDLPSTESSAPESSAPESDTPESDTPESNTPGSNASGSSTTPPSSTADESPAEGSPPTPSDPGHPAALRGVLAALPVAGVSGTLHDRFLSAESRDAAGIARAKTGTLTGISGLAGTTVTADGLLLTYVVLADKVPSSTGTLAARSALDQVVATLTDCGCR